MIQKYMQEIRVNVADSPITRRCGTFSNFGQIVSFLSISQLIRKIEK